jgi:hypothetical protein
MISLPIFLQMVLEYDAMEAGLSLAPLSLTLLIPLFASLLGLVNGYRMTRLPDPKPSAAAESVLGG